MLSHDPDKLISKKMCCYHILIMVQLWQSDVFQLITAFTFKLFDLNKTIWVWDVIISQISDLGKKIHILFEFE